MRSKNITKGSGNVFADLGFEDAAEYKAKADLAMEVIQKEALYQQGIANLKLEGRGWTDEQDQIARSYLSGKINKQQLIEKALQYAKTNKKAGQGG